MNRRERRRQRKGKRHRERIPPVVTCQIERKVEAETGVGDVAPAGNGAYEREVEPETVIEEGKSYGEREWLTPRQMCDWLAISRSTLDRQLVPGRTKIGGQVRYHRPTVEKWLHGN